MEICYIVGAGDCTELNIDKQAGDLIIAADAGYRYLKNAGIEPDAIIGDFDSLGEVPAGENVIKLNPIKDLTDTEAAINLGEEKGFSEFHIYGALGGRFDHTLGNIQLLASIAQKNLKVFIFNGNTVITAVHNGKISFDSSYSGYISVLSHTDECRGVYIKGLKYELDDAVLVNTSTFGVSNEFIGKESEIIIGSGTAVIIYSI